MNIAHSKLQQAVILDQRVRQSGQYLDIIADIQDQRDVITERRAIILSTIPGFDAARIAEEMAKMKAIEEGKREELIELGAIRETL